MSLASDLMGMGMPAAQAQSVATGGDNTPSGLQIAAAGSNRATATQLGGHQFVASVNSGTGGVNLPSLGGSNGCLLADDFVINNATGSTITVYAPGSANISFGGSNTAGSTGVSITTHTSATFYYVSATQVIGVKGS